MKNNVLNIILILIFFSSCAGTSEDQNKVITINDNTIHETLVKEVKEVKEISKTKPKSNSRIIGSAIIDHPQNYKGKTYFLYGAEHLDLENYYFDFPVVYNKSVKKWMKYFLGRGRPFFERYGARAGRYAPLLGQILENHGLPRDLIFLAMAESGFQTAAKSWASAVGPWQFMSYTGKRFGLKIDWYVDERRDPIKATIAAAKYLKILYKDFESWELAAAAYNAGEGKISRAIKRYRTESFWKLRNRRYLKSETKNYVPKIMALAIIGKNLNSFGFGDLTFHEPLDFDEVNVGPNVDLYKVAKAIGISFEDLQDLNPEILRWFTSPYNKEYPLRLPVGKSEIYNKLCLNNVAMNADSYQHYTVRGRRSKLKDVARKFKIKDLKVLVHLNSHISKNRYIKRGTPVLLPFKIGQSKKENMYADLYEKPRKSIRRLRSYRKRIRVAKSKGRAIRRPSRYYTVKRGDSLWTVARKNGISLDNLIASNLKIIKRRRIRAGDRLAVK